MFNRKSVLTACGVAILGLVMTAPGNAGVDATRMNHLTFSGPVALPGTTLRAGTYIFELADPIVSPDLVRVLNRDRSRVYLTVFTMKTERPEGMPADRLVSFGEARAGIAPPITAWFPVGESTGHQFIYR